MVRKQMYANHLSRVAPRSHRAMFMPHQQAASAGFSFVEALISGVLLMIVIMNSARMFTRSQGTMKSSSLRDAAYTRIAEDLDPLRQLSWSWACEDGTEIDTSLTVQPSPAACTGNDSDINTEVRYKTGRSDTLIDRNTQYYGAESLVSRYKKACSDKKVAELMKDEAKLSGQTSLAFRDSKILRFNDPESSARSNPTLTSSGLEINRSISFANNGSDKNRLEVTYATLTPFKITVKSTIVPQALAWCA